MKQCKHRNITISVIWDLYISLSIGDCMERERGGAISIHETVQTQKQYYLHNTRSAYFPIERERGYVHLWNGENTEMVLSHNMRSGYFPINRRLHREREEQEREAMSIHEMVKTQKWYYICHMRYAYFPINRRLHREREQVRARERGYICPWNSEDTETVLSV